MTKSQIIEEPCEVKVSCTVLKTSMKGDFLAEFNKWSWVERTDWTMLEQAAAILADSSNLSRMIDLEGTRQMICLDNLSPHEVACLMAAHSKENGENDLLLNGGDDMILPPSADENVPVEAS